MSRWNAAFSRWSTVSSGQVGPISREDVASWLGNAWVSRGDEPFYGEGAPFQGENGAMSEEDEPISREKPAISCWNGTISR